MKTRCTLVLSLETTTFFLLQNRLDLHTKERLYSTSVLIVTINGGVDDNFN